MEITARIKRDELLALLSTMTPAEQQPITARARLSDIEAELRRQGIAQPKQMPKVLSTSQAAALLRPCKPRNRPPTLVEPVLKVAALATPPPAAPIEVIEEPAEIHSKPNAEIREALQVTSAIVPRVDTRYIAIMLVYFVAAFLFGSISVYFIL